MGIANSYSTWDVWATLARVLRSEAWAVFSMLSARASSSDGNVAVRSLDILGRSVVWARNPLPLYMGNSSCAPPKESSSPQPEDVSGRGVTTFANASKAVTHLAFGPGHVWSNEHT